MAHPYWRENSPGTGIEPLACVPNRMGPLIFFLIPYSVWGLPGGTGSPWINKTI